jgi:hypothetical protein
MTKTATGKLTKTCGFSLPPKQIENLTKFAAEKTLSTGKKVSASQVVSRALAKFGVKND